MLRVMAVKVLPVEDDSDYREVIHLNLEMQGFEVDVAGEGKAAVEIAKTQNRASS
ncbi:MAG TPA: hypothetical protein VIL74_14160 [Pyrinomonadaceae bacterium]|jgi:DNA-binding response OmpR family regulator